MSERTFRTRIEHERWTRGLTQDQMSQRTGISLRTYRRLENGSIENPPIGYLVNCALVLNLSLEDILESEWLTWMSFDDTVEPPRRRVSITKSKRS